jgi:hypothetical protein
MGTTADPAPGDQLAGNAHAAAGVVVIEAKYPCKMTVHRRRPRAGVTPARRHRR